jgi:DNA-binding transcriptional MerR regulator
MRISELSQRSGVSVASIKFYVREGLLAPGVPTARNQANYDDEHVRRLRLIRALIDGGGLSLANVRAVLRAVDDETTTLHDAFGAVMHALDELGQPVDADVAATEAEVRDWLARRDWRIKPGAPAPQVLAELLVTLHMFGVPLTIDAFDAEADAASARARAEVAYARAQPSRAAAVETMVLGTVVIERIFAQLRRLALEAESARLEDAAADVSATSATNPTRQPASTPAPRAGRSPRPRTPRAAANRSG